MAALFFALLKFAGYALFLGFIKAKPARFNIYGIALCRLVAGVIVGMTLFSLLAEGRDILPTYLVAILAGRILLWLAVFTFFYRLEDHRRLAGYVFAGVLVSYALDIPAVFGFIAITGGIC